MDLFGVHLPFDQLMALFLAFPRMLAFFSILPILNRQALPGILRIGVAGAFAIFLVPGLIDPATAMQLDAARVLIICVKEAILGFALGFVTAVPIWAFEAMGNYIDNQRGASIAETINPLTGHEASPLGDIFSQMIVVLLFISGGFSAMVASVQDSYRLWSVLGMGPDFDAATPQFFLSQLDRMTRIALLMGAPVIFTMFIAEMGLALVSRFVPQLQVFFLAMPIKSALAMLIFAAYAVLLVDYASGEIKDMSATALSNLARIFR
ncbi:type III secretion system export apparatus subunit SctT [Noviherbaspirillum pedocola]|uniref:Type III secretion system export apparatus subunit SctT n=1 Tax=Noviherbaspirillum pedocola TaxID=2801341 RepID=A0A934SME2_9BURK|nr:type III secretion system export apparatus subunit SctT [Noviherbaspirillum pedocola]MBK4733246.1 type III secretion system export apparatus subunit SctT [Noviherbaspirillum pedocola]